MKLFLPSLYNFRDMEILLLLSVWINLDFIETDGLDFSKLIHNFHAPTPNGVIVDALESSH